MTYNQLVRQAEHILYGKAPSIYTSKDIVHDLYLKMHARGIDLLNIKGKPNGFFYHALKQAFINSTYRITWRYVKEDDKWVRSYLNNHQIADYHSVSYDFEDNILEDIYSAELIKKVRDLIKLKVPDHPIYLPLFDFIIQGYKSHEIREEIGLSIENIYYYKTRIKKWIEDEKLLLGR